MAGPAVFRLLDASAKFPISPEKTLLALSGVFQIVSNEICCDLKTL